MFILFIGWFSTRVVVLCIDGERIDLPHLRVGDSQYGSNSVFCYMFQINLSTILTDD